MLYLASQSPRRFELLKQLNLDFRQFSVDVDETPRKEELPKEYVKRIIQLKSNNAKAHVSKDDIVLVADTTVVCDEVIMGKPKNYEDAKSMLLRLSGKTHEVFSGVGIVCNDYFEEALTISQVTFRAISESEIKAYWQLKEPYDKAGAYAIQGVGSIFIKSIYGSYSAIMGLDLYQVAKLLDKFGFNVLGHLE
ncbi:Maf family protein [Thiotrichales bacterium 19S9-12]|nr:Maf family protein [Thiotrichales bacterium 19S9-11]MCF6811090.1 Maf family protein [Thiotrichales bacterium 19S9-12]